jgi:hypothetical protein
MSCEFDCAQCGVHVLAVGVDAVPPGQRCGICQWLDDIPDEAAREQLRRRLELRVEMFC